MGVMSFILGAFESLSQQTLTMLQEYTDIWEDDLPQINVIIDYLGSLLIGVSKDSDEDTTIRLCHTSFRDFLCDQSRSGDFSIDLSSAHQSLAVASIKLMSDENMDLSLTSATFLLHACLTARFQASRRKFRS